jgi:hypothetical protein
VTSDLEIFASFVRSEEQKERDAKKAAREQRRQADEHNQLIKAKEDAAALVKRLRASDHATAEQKAAADAAYKAALAAVVAHETGEAPAWAPTAPEPEAENEPEDGAEAEHPDETEPGSGSEDAAPEVAEAEQ